ATDPPAGPAGRGLHLDPPAGPGSPMSRPPVAHRVTSAHLQAAYPFVAEGGLPCTRVYVGRDLFGSSFVFDPWQLYQQRIITGLNMLVLGMIGRGKSALVKSLLLRSVLHGIRGVVFDVK